MTEKELRRLGRAGLLELLLDQRREVERLQAEVKRLNEELHSRSLLISEAGSIAEASLRINHVFEAAQRAADQYLENVRQQCGALPGGGAPPDSQNNVECDVSDGVAENQAQG